MFNLTQGPRRERLDPDEVAQLQGTGVLIPHEQRNRPFYFDGRFLAATDLTREQQYFLSRQAELGRAGGSGVVSGLTVRRRTQRASLIEIASGHGVTPQGEMVVVSEPLQIDVADVPQIQRLDAAFGLSQIPNEPIRNLSGLYIVGLRPVEYTANPIGAYPTSITGPRSVEDSEIIEAVAVTLIPFTTGGALAELEHHRARIVRSVFLERAGNNVPADVLPLAMIALDRGVIQWVDVYLVRREVGAEHGDVLGLGFAPRALREAHLLQYDRQLEEIVTSRRAANQGADFPAATYFFALPPAGRMPAATLNPANFTQTYFPSEIDVDLSIVPDDEIPALLEESLLLPPIDLTLSGDELESTSILIVVPVPRQNLRRLRERLPALTRPLKPAVSGAVAKRRPHEILQRFVLTPQISQPIIPLQNLVDAAWSEVLSEQEFLWFIRRRNLQYKAEVVGVSTHAFQDDTEIASRAIDTIETHGLGARFSAIQERASILANSEVITLFSSSKFAESRLLATAAIVELEQMATLDRRETSKVTERFADPKIGEGTKRLEAVLTDSGDQEAIFTNLTNSGAVPELDKLVRSVDERELPELTAELSSVALANNPAETAAFIKINLLRVQR